MTSRTRSILAVLVCVLVVSGLPLASAAPADASKMRGGLADLIELGYQPDARLDYLVPGFARGQFVAYVLVDGKAPSRVKDVAATGARVRWAFRSIDAVSVVATKEQLLSLAARPWVRALYPVGSGRVDQAPSISGTMTRTDAPRSHDVAVPAGAKSITVDLKVTPPTPPHFDFNVSDFLEARLVDPHGRLVMARPSLLHTISFRYGEDALEAGTWRLELWYRNANRPVAPLVFAYAGDAVASTDAVSRDQAAPIPAVGCASAPETSRWKSHPNLKRRGVSDVGAPVLWNTGIRGRGVRLAVLDTGVDASHVDLDDQDWERWGQAGCADKVIADALFTGAQKIDGQGVVDTGGHGTHVASEAAGTAEGTTDAEKAQYPGVAPEASIIAGRIAIDVTALSDDMLAAAEWAVIDQDADVVNLSFGIDVRYGVLTDQYDPQAAGFEALVLNPDWGHPAIFTSAGNSGDRFSTIGVPAAAAHVISVAASTKDWDLELRGGESRENGATTGRGAKDKAGRVRPSIAAFSSRGPSQDLFFSPDISAPGRDIVAAMTNYPGTTNDGTVQNGYVSFSGTSMAAPHATGSAALLVDAYRKAFAASARVPFWLLSAALSNTAGSVAARPSWAGGPLSKVTYDRTPVGTFQMYGEGASRENGDEVTRPVGSLVEGAGRINLPAAQAALTRGLLVYTTGDSANPGPYDLQSSIHAGILKPGETGMRTLALHPATSHAYDVTFRAVGGVPSLNAKVIPASWWSLPGATTATGATKAGVSLKVPAGAKPGIYTGYVLADATDRVTGERFSLRLPAMVVVEIADYSAQEGDGQRAIVDGFTRAYDYTTFLTLVVIDAVNNDWPMYAIEAPQGLQSLKLELTGQGASNDDWDLFVYDERGLAVGDTANGVPGPSPSLTLSGLAPGNYRVAVSLSVPSDSSVTVSDPRGVPFRLTADLVGAATPPVTEVKGVRRAAPKAPAKSGSLPATGVDAGFVVALLSLAAAIAFARRLRRA